MGNKNALITKAMLASYINDKKIDYLDMISPFILKVLPERVGAMINVEEITKKVNDEYGLDIKQKIVAKILNRLCKDKHDNLIKKEASRGDFLRNEESTKNYYVNKEIDNTLFDKRKEQMKHSVDEVVERLKCYLNKEYTVLKPISNDEAQKYFLKFLEDYNFELYSTVDNLRKIQGKERSNSNNFHVAKFILNEYSLKEMGCYKQIEKIQEGYFASVAIYHFCNSANSDNPHKIIDQTRIFLDTRLLIDVLELNRESEARSMAELVALINKNGGKLCTFDYYVDELIGIVHKYLTDTSSRLTLDLERFRRNKTSDAEISLFKEGIRGRLKDKGVEIIQEFDYGQQVEEKTWHIDSLELRRNMRSLINYSGGDNAPAFKNDEDTLERIAYCKYESVMHNAQKAIFVTTNSGLIKVARNTFRDSFFKNDIDIVISDIDLAAALWLSNYNPDSNLSNLILLENAYAAIYPDKDILSEVLRIIEDGINGSDEQIKKDAFTLRSNERLAEEIAEITQNNKGKVSPTIVQELADRMRREAYNKAVITVQNEYVDKIRNEVIRDLDERKITLDEKEITINQKEVEIESKYQYAKEVDKKNEETQKRYEQKVEELDLSYEENRRLKKENEDLRHAEIERISKWAKRFQVVFKVTCYLVLVLLCRYVLLNVAIALFGSTIAAMLKMPEEDLVNAMATFVGTILTFCPVVLFMKSTIDKCSNRVFDYVYQKLISKSAILNKKEL